MLATPIAVGFTVLSASSPAEAGSEINGPSTVTSGSSVTVSAQIDNVVRVELQVAAPGGAFHAIDSGGNLIGSTRLSNSVDIPHNGVYKVRLKGSVTGKIYETKNFTVRVPPAAPSGLRTSASGGKVVARWTRGAEDDLAGYQVAASGVRSRTASTSALCAGAVCSTTFSLPSTAQGQVGVTVRALRPDGSGGTVRSGASSSHVTVPARSGGTTADASPSGSGIGSGAGVPSLNPLNPLNPLQNNSSLNLPAAPGGGAPGFEYPTPGPEVAGPEQADPSAKNVSATSSLEWGKSLAIALILLIVAAHLGTWTRRTRVAQALAGRGGRTGAGRERVRAARERIARAEAEARSASAGATEGGEQNGAASHSSGTRHTAAPSSAKPPMRSKSATSSMSGSKPTSRSGSTSGSGPGARAVSQTGATKAPSRHSGGGYRGRRRAQ
ncbi:hypothetical protein [Actinomadura sp. HBU206391]|uniref:hypothetical protein n=1 Tax=Actinomadura sp. HBU206391 TaxID=2731692 RepID=UPI00164FC1B5|nr:hypothetical protein [Actinomadura sp. HBU206391]